MPYISKAARERARWITVREALSIIETADSCETKEAWRQLRDAIADGAVAAKWDDASIHGSGQLGRLHFKFAKLNKGGTKVRVPDRRSQSAGNHRLLMVSRESLRRSWASHAEGLSGPSPEKRGPGRGSARFAIREELNKMKSEEKDVSGSLALLAREIAKRLGKNWIRRGTGALAQ